MKFKTDGVLNACDTCRLETTLDSVIYCGDCGALECESCRVFDQEFCTRCIERKAGTTVAGALAVAASAAREAAESLSSGGKLVDARRDARKIGKAWDDLKAALRDIEKALDRLVD